ncbi:MAG TPA: MEDS domain-containing protein [Micropepsaceae bacterium]|nr:MEDS domain-containing protein [Micropepsaceae bacterium]
MQSVKAFWAELSPCDHFVQIYEDDAIFIKTLVKFVGDGLRTGEACVVIATPDHCKALDRELRFAGLDPATAAYTDRLICLDAANTIDKFMVNDWPDDQLFNEVVTEVLRRATGNGRRVRAFGEMVALMWAKGLCGATIKLEHLWTELCRRQNFALFCAYPKSGFTEDMTDSISRVCEVHSKVCETGAV